MKLPRRRFLHLAADSAVLPAMSRIAWARSYPTRPVHWIVGFPAGSGPDIAARLMGQWLSERLGQQVVVEDRPGAGGSIATEAVVYAAPDGYSLLCATAANAINATLYQNLKFDFVRDIAPVASIGNIPFVMAVNPSLSAKSVPEFIGYAKANPSKINMASAGIGSMTHVSGALFKVMAGRSTALPDIPTVGEFVPGYDATGWYGVGAPKSTPADIVDKLNREVNAGLADPKVKARLADVGVEPTPMTPAEFGKLIADDTEKWAKVIRAANIKPE
jgi:tripartite-type tricarboxylate transporter receptor subunit TctC